MTETDQTTAVGSLAADDPAAPRTPRRLTLAVWALWLGSLPVVGAQAVGDAWVLPGVFVVDGLTALLWSVVTFFSGIVLSYARRYLAGSAGISGFARRVFGFTLAVGVLLAADSLLLFGLAWLAMGLVMADLIGHVDGWPQATAAGRLARRYFLAGTGLLAVGFGTLWLATGATTVSGVVAAAGTLPPTALWVGVGALVGAAAVQSALLPFHGWLLSSMTAPTPASALMHAGFVNAGGILLARFAPLVVADPGLLAVVAAVGATSALGGKLLKTVQPDVKRQLGCSTVGQMGFMLLQAGLGFFGAAVTHLVLHGFYKAYQFLSTGERVERTTPGAGHAEGPTLAGVVVGLATGVAGGAVFVTVTGKGATLDGGVVLTLLVVVTTLHAARGFVDRRSLPAPARYLAVPAVALPAVAGYGLAYTAVTGLLSGLPVVTRPTTDPVVTGVVAGGFLLAYVAVETGVYERSRRLYAWAVAAGQPPTATLTTDTGVRDD